MSTVEVWVLPGSAPIDEGCLSAQEQARAATMAAPGAAARHRRGRALLRHAVGALTGLDPAAVPLSSTTRGRPVVDGGPWVSLSHTQDVVVVAACAAALVGVDVEVVGTRRRPVPTAAVTAARRAAVADLVDQHLAPLAVWVVLEAALKAAGTGLAQPHQQARFAAVPGGVLVDLAVGGNHGCCLRALPGGTVVAVATPRTVPVVRWHGHHLQPLHSPGPAVRGRATG